MYLTPFFHSYIYSLIKNGSTKTGPASAANQPLCSFLRSFVRSFELCRGTVM